MLTSFFEILAGLKIGAPRVLTLSRMMLKKNNKGTDLGWLWSVLKPLFYIVMFYAAMNLGFKSVKDIDGIHCPYFIWLATGIIAWRYIQGLLVGGASCFTRHSQLIKNTNLPIPVYPLIPVLSGLYIHLIMAVVLLIMAVLSGAKPSVYWVQLPLFMVISMTFCYFWAFITGMLHVLSKDFINIIKSIQPAFFWLSGIFFNSRTRSSIIFTFNPITFIVEGYRNALCFEMWFWKNHAALKGFTLVLFIMLTITLIMYRKLKNRFAEIV